MDNTVGLLDIKTGLTTKCPVNITGKLLSIKINENNLFYVYFDLDFAGQEWHGFKYVLKAFSTGNIVEEGYIDFHKLDGVSYNFYNENDNYWDKNLKKIAKAGEVIDITEILPNTMNTLNELIDFYCNN
jgi:hypothetical protein